MLLSELFIRRGNATAPAGGGPAPAVPPAPPAPPPWVSEALATRIAQMYAFQAAARPLHLDELARLLQADRERAPAE